MSATTMTKNQKRVLRSAMRRYDKLVSTVVEQLDAESTQFLADVKAATEFGLKEASVHPAMNLVNIAAGMILMMRRKKESEQQTMTE